MSLNLLDHQQRAINRLFLPIFRTATENSSLHYLLSCHHVLSRGSDHILLLSSQAGSGTLNTILCHPSKDRLKMPRGTPPYQRSRGPLPLCAWTPAKPKPSPSRRPCRSSVSAFSAKLACRDSGCSLPLPASSGPTHRRLQISLAAHFTAGDEAQRNLRSAGLLRTVAGVCPQPSF